MYASPLPSHSALRADPACGLGSGACSLHAAGRPAGLLPAPSPGSRLQCRPTDPGLPPVLRSPKPSQEHWASRAVSLHGAQETLLVPLEGHSPHLQPKERKLDTRYFICHSVLAYPFYFKTIIIFNAVERKKDLLYISFT